MRIAVNTLAERKCYKCNEVKPLTSEYFYREKNREFGFAYRCKDCDKAKGRKWHPNRTFSPDQLENRKKAKDKYTKSLQGKVFRFLNSYRAYDKKKGLEFDLTFEFIQEVMSMPCVYCGDTEETVGCDRLDNTKGHIQSNIVPACRTCNITRFDNFSFEEMKLIGKCVAEIKKARRSKEDYG